jgi:DNA polymerase III delta prime subunit
MPQYSEKREILNKAAQSAKNLFRYLAEIKSLQSPVVRDLRDYKTVIWLEDIPREKGCFCEAWRLFGEPEEDDGSGAWISVHKPNMIPPPELPDGIDTFVDQKEWRDSSVDQPSLKEPTREELIRQFLPDEDIEPDVEELRIKENDHVFEEYVRYVDKEWRLWAEAKRADDSLDDPVPMPAEVLKPWLSSEHLTDFHLEEPPIAQQVSVEVDRVFQEAKRVLEERWINYVETKWKPWAVKDRPLRMVQETYNQLYTTYQSYQKLGEQYEVVMGFGLLNWKTKKSGRVNRHIMVCDVAISFDAGAGQLYVTGNPNGIKLRAESEMLDTDDRPQRHEMEMIESQIKGIQNDVWDEAFLRDLPKRFVNSLSDERGVFEMSMERKRPEADIPRIDLAPALILRKRSQRGYIRLLEEMEEQVEETSIVPRGILEIIDPDAAEEARLEQVKASNQEDDEHESLQTEWNGTENSGGATSLSDREIYFPLPANKEQFEIAHRLNYGRDVLVQGPPGTGKTHTITNLICHLLAKGERVLLTSETSRGLESLRSKFRGAAEPLANLCVVLLGNDAESIEELERSVQSINSKLTVFDDKKASRTVEELKGALLDVRSNKRRTAQELKAIREKDTYKYQTKFGRYSGTLECIAGIIREETNDFSWLLDDVDENVSATDVLGDQVDAFVREWCKLNKPRDIDRRLVGFEVDRLLSAARFGELARTLVAQEKIVEKVIGSADRRIAEAIKTIDRRATEELRYEISAILAGMRQLDDHIFSWSLDAGKEIVAEQDRHWRELLEVTVAELQRCGTQVRDVSSIEVSGVEDGAIRRLLISVDILKKDIKANGRWKKSLFAPKPIKDAHKALSGVLVDGLPVRDAESLSQLGDWLIGKDALANLKRNWGDLGARIGGTLNMQIAQFKDRVEPLELAVSLHPHVVKAQLLIDEIGAFGAPKWHSIGELQSFLNGLELQAETDTLNAKAAEYENMKANAVAILKGSPRHRAFVEMAFQKRDPVAYATLIEHVTKYNLAVDKREQLLRKARSFRSRFPNTFGQFLATDEVDIWSSRLCNLQAAMNWRRARAWVAELCDSRVAELLSSKLTQLDEDEHKILGELAAELAWKHCLGRLTASHNQRQAMIAWMQAIRKIGGGTGKYVEVHRATAREELQRCQAAIPAWVMPMHRVVENVKAIPEQFDVAIIDEASQSGPEALILNYIAKKVVVVGDDKQIRPQNVGIDRGQINYFQHTYLAGIEHSESFDLESSYFSQAELRFQNQIRLKEHFRCMPEIILFSNNHFYSSDPLIPLRQFGVSRLMPVVKAEYVDGGFVSGRGTQRINEPEAKRLVELIAECCEDPSYDDKSMGVICLTGGEQEQLIKKLLIDEIEAEEIEARNILVGRPYTFQGDERDVIFMSMVNAPVDGNRCRLVSGQAKEREFNVAASRARDQLVLIHSATLNDLSPDCLQYKLLNHCLKPKIEQDDIDGQSIQDESPRVFRRHFSLSQAASADSSNRR